REVGSEHPRSPGARAAGAARGADARGLLRLRARGAAAADPRSPGGGLQPRRDQAAARGLARDGGAPAARAAVACDQRPGRSDRDAERGRAGAAVRDRGRDRPAPPGGLGGPDHDLPGVAEYGDRGRVQRDHPQALGAEAVSAEDAQAQMLERWQRAARGWSIRADEIRDFGMPVSVWMIDHLHLQPGQRVLELAAGPGDTGLMAAELVSPGGTLISTDVAPPMLDIARRRAGAVGLENVEFIDVDLQWIVLELASVGAALCCCRVIVASD